MQLLVKIKHIFYSNMIEHDRWISCTPTIKIDQKQTKESDQQFIMYHSQDHSFLKSCFTQIQSFMMTHNI